MSFHGAKLAILVGEAVVTILRDDIAGIPWPGHWDLPGGGREGAESPEDCALRECREELGLDYPASALGWRRAFPRSDGGLGWFFGLRDEGFDAARVRFGDEGQGWQLMPVAEFLRHPRAVPSLQARLTVMLGEGL